MPPAPCHITPSVVTCALHLRGHHPSPPTPDSPTSKHPSPGRTAASCGSGPPTMITRPQATSTPLPDRESRLTGECGERRTAHRRGGGRSGRPILARPGPGCLRSASAARCWLRRAGTACPPAPTAQRPGAGDPRPRRHRVVAFGPYRTRDLATGRLEGSEFDVQRYDQLGLVAYARYVTANVTRSPSSTCCSPTRLGLPRSSPHDSGTPAP